MHEISISSKSLLGINVRLNFYASCKRTDYLLLGDMELSGLLHKTEIQNARSIIVNFLEKMRDAVRKPLQASKRFDSFGRIEETAEGAAQILDLCNMMGEGWLLTGEMVELIKAGTPNIVCTQPFACLPNHVVGKAVIKELRKRYPEANIVAVDYDPGASEVNQLNRIKLMISVAKENLKQKTK